MGCRMVGLGGRQLIGVTIPARHQHGAAALALGSGRRQKIVGLVTGSLRVGEPTGGDELRKDVELIDQLVIELTSRLIALKRAVAVGRLVQRVPTDQHRAWPLGFVKAEKKIGESDDGAATPVTPPTNGFRQRVVRAVRERVTVDDEEGTGHLDRCSSVSITTSDGFLSSRNPRNAG